MRNINKTSEQLRWVILLLLIAVILPTVCLLWFMTQAVKNEQMAVKQKLIDVYTKRGQYYFVEVPDLYFSSKIEHFNSLTNHEPWRLFDFFAVSPDSQFDGALILDTDNKLVYPILDTFETPTYDQFIEPFQIELAGNLEKAIEQYKKIADETQDQNLRYKVMLSQARCFDKLDRKKEAIEIAYKLSYPSNPENVEPELASIIMHCRIFLAELYKETKDENLYYHIRRILGNSRYNNEKESGFLDGPAETTIWQLDKLITIAQQTGLDEKLQREIDSAKDRIKPYQNAVWAASIFSDAEKLNTWSVQTIRKLSPESDMYGLKFKLANKTILGFSHPEAMLKILNACVSDMQDDITSVQVYNNFGQLIAGNENLKSKPFLTFSPGKFFPDFKVDIHFKDNSVFETAATKQAAIYRWTGVLVVLFILLTGGLAAGSIGRQIKLNRLKNDFIATVSHELKTPLSSMRVLADTLLEGNYKDQTQATEYLQLICKENERLSRLIDNFLTFSRMERNKRAFDMVRIEPREISKGAVEAVQTKLDKGKCELEVSIEPNLPPVSADKDAMVTALVNLLDNACKYSLDEKRIKLTVSAENSFVNFSVSDNGIGMSRRVAKKIFNRFYQADQSLSRKTEGCGLGLSIVKFIVDTHKGQISVDSEPGKGTTFTVRLSAAEG
jgi:signal transduction histidine kinase